MNKFIGKQAYQKTVVSSPRVEDAHAAITVCLETLLHNLKILKEMPSGSSELHSKVASKCLTAIYILQSSLDFENGKSVADSLFKLYEYVKYQVLANARKFDESDLGSAVTVIAEISDTWKSIK